MVLTDWTLFKYILSNSIAAYRRIGNNVEVRVIVHCLDGWEQAEQLCSSFPKQLPMGLKPLQEASRFGPGISRPEDLIQGNAFPFLRPEATFMGQRIPEEWIVKIQYRAPIEGWDTKTVVSKG